MIKIAFLSNEVDFKWMGVGFCCSICYGWAWNEILAIFIQLLWILLLCLR